jgi:hypothetical protein
MDDGGAVRILELSAHRDAMRDAREADAAATQRFADIMCGGFPFHGGIGSDDHLPDAPGRNERDELLNTERLGADAVDRRQVAMQNELAPAIPPRLLHGKNVGRGFDDAQQRLIAARIAAHAAELMLAQRATPPAIAHTIDGSGERSGQLLATGAVMAQDAERHPLSGFRTDPRQNLETLDQLFNQRTDVHGAVVKKAA